MDAYVETMEDNLAALEDIYTSLTVYRDLMSEYCQSDMELAGYRFFADKAEEALSVVWTGTLLMRKTLDAIEADINAAYDKARKEKHE